MNTFVSGLVLLSMVAVAPSSKYHVTVTVDKDVDFTALHTYAWAPGWSTRKGRSIWAANSTS